jgi:ABC-type antimicrobial peptide transport system permease subunit
MASVVGRALRMTLGGVILGLLGAWMLTKSLGELLFQVSARDSATFAGVAALIVVIGVMASVIPARRAMRADPMEALRGE